MGLTIRNLLNKYFSKEQIQDALRDTGELLTGSKNELANRLVATWESHNKNWYDLLDYLDDEYLAMICDDYSLDSDGDEAILKRRIKKANLLESSKKIKNEKGGEKNPDPDTKVTIVGHSNYVNVGKDNKIALHNKKNDHKIIKIIFVAAAIATIASVILAYYQFATNDVEQPPQNTDAENTLSESQDPFSFEFVLSAYERNQPFTINWTNCGLSTETDPTDPTEKIVAYKFYMKPIILDENGNPTTIPFNTNYYFRTSILTKDIIYYSDFDSISLGIHLVEPSDRRDIELDMTEIFNSAKQFSNPLSLKLELYSSSLAPYSTKSEKNVMDYSHDDTIKVVTEFTYLPEPYDKWVESETTNNSICNNIFKK